MLDLALNHEEELRKKSGMKFLRIEINLEE